MECHIESCLKCERRQLANGHDSVLTSPDKKNADSFEEFFTRTTKPLLVSYLHLAVRVHLQKCLYLTTTVTDQNKLLATELLSVYWSDLGFGPLVPTDHPTRRFACENPLNLFSAWLFPVCNPAR